MLPRAALESATTCSLSEPWRRFRKKCSRPCGAGSLTTPCEDRKIHFVKARTGVDDGRTIEILSGLRKGELVALNLASDTREGAEGALARLRYGCAKRSAALAAARRGLALSQLDMHDPGGIQIVAPFQSKQS
jgi:hypothetical protein